MLSLNIKSLTSAFPPLRYTRSWRSAVHSPIFISEAVFFRPSIAAVHNIQPRNPGRCCLVSFISHYQSAIRIKAYLYYHQYLPNFLGDKDPKVHNGRLQRLSITLIVCIGGLSRKGYVEERKLLRKMIILRK